jgi:hypothetical protein
MVDTSMLTSWLEGKLYRTVGWNRRILGCTHLVVFDMLCEEQEIGNGGECDEVKWVG